MMEYWLVSLWQVCVCLDACAFVRVCMSVECAIYVASFWNAMVVGISSIASTIILYRKSPLVQQKLKNDL